MHSWPAWQTTIARPPPPRREGLLLPGHRGRPSRVARSAYHQESNNGAHAAAVRQEELLHPGTGRFQKASDSPGVDLEKTDQELQVGPSVLQRSPPPEGPPLPGAKAHLGPLQVQAHQPRAGGGQQAEGLGGNPAAVAEAQRGQERAGGGQSLQREGGTGLLALSTPSQAEGRDGSPAGPTHLQHRRDEALPVAEREVAQEGEPAGHRRSSVRVQGGPRGGA